MACVAIEPSRRSGGPVRSRIAALIARVGPGLVGLILLMVGGCTATPAERGSAAEVIALQGGLARSTVRSQGFVLTTWSRIAAPADDVHVYIEGDGYAWETSTDPSSDPTPLNPLALRLAAADDAHNVLYLARPCQFRPAGTRDSCQTSFWTTHRFAESVVVSLNDAIDRTLAPSPRRRLTLIGYSGGGGIAVLLAARRTDVAAVVSIAGNIAHGVWTSHHGVTPLRGSLDPIDSAARLATVPQLHLVGANDKIMPRLVADTFARRSPPDSCIRVVSMSDASHDKGWLENWPALLTRIPTCPLAGHAPAPPEPAR
jgi:hypothetical protein